MTETVPPTVDTIELKGWCDTHAQLLDVLRGELGGVSDCPPPPVPMPIWAHDFEVSSAGGCSAHLEQSTTLDHEGITAIVGRSYFIDRESGEIEVCGPTDFLVKWEDEAGGSECFAASPAQARRLIGILQASLDLIGGGE